MNTSEVGVGHGLQIMIIGQVQDLLLQRQQEAQAVEQEKKLDPQM